MSVNKIKANFIEFEGEYVHITRCPMRILWFFGGIAFGIFTVFFFINPVFHTYGIKDEYMLIYYSLFILFSGFTFVFSAGEKEEYLVPKVDVLTMKKYPESRKVTVVLDDERTKRRQPVTKK